jgi:hypothetical protein
MPKIKKNEREKKIKISSLGNGFLKKNNITNIIKTKEYLYHKYKYYLKKKNKNDEDINKIGIYAHNLALIFDHQKEYNIAKEYYKIASTNNSIDSHFNLGVLYMEQKRINKALYYFDKMNNDDIKKRNMFKNIYINKAILYYELEKNKLFNNINLRNLKDILFKLMKNKYNIYHTILTKLLINFLEKDFLTAILNYKSIDDKNQFNKILINFHDYLSEENSLFSRILHFYKYKRGKTIVVLNKIKNNKSDVNVLSIIKNI